jgi:antitoxin component YwqK of YwqJK toxin-antitoxin module
MQSNYTALKRSFFYTLIYTALLFFVSANICGQNIIKSHGNGTPNIVGQLIDNLKQGQWIEISPQGDTLAIVHFKDDKIDGAFMFTENATELNPNEILVQELKNYSQLFEIDYKAKGFIKNSLLQGEYIVYTATGSIGSKTIFDQGKANGLRQSYFLTGEKSFEENYLNDQLNGTWKKFYKSGKIREERNYTLGIQQTSILYEWTTEGLPSKQISYILIPKADGNFEKLNHGKWTQHYESGALLSESYYDMGAPDKVWIGYYESGNVKYKMTYADKVYIGYEKFEDK